MKDDTLPPAPDRTRHDLLVAFGYKLVEDAWKEFGRLTYMHDDDADRDHIKNLARAPRSSGWRPDARKLRTLHHSASGDEIELEPGGSGVRGHFLHYIKSWPRARRGYFPS
jgi:hypothetical protein